MLELPISRLLIGRWSYIRESYWRKLKPGHPKSLYPASKVIFYIGLVYLWTTLHGFLAYCRGFINSITLKLFSWMLTCMCLKSNFDIWNTIYYLKVDFFINTILRSAVSSFNHLFIWLLRGLVTCQLIGQSPLIIGWNWHWRCGTEIYYLQGKIVWDNIPIEQVN